MITASQYLARRENPQTSHDAATRTVAFRGKHEALIYSVICDRDRLELGCTAKEISDILMGRLTDVQVNRRLSAMGERGLIFRSTNGNWRNKLIQRNGCCVWFKA